MRLLKPYLGDDITLTERDGSPAVGEGGYLILDDGRRVWLSYEDIYDRAMLKIIGDALRSTKRGATRQQAARACLEALRNYLVSY